MVTAIQLTRAHIRAHARSTLVSRACPSLVCQCDLPSSSATIRQRTTSTPGLHAFFPRIMGGKKKGGIDEFHYRCTNLRIFAFIVSRFQRVFFSFFGVLRSISALVASDGTQLESDTRVIIRRGWRNGRIQRAVTFSKISGLTVGVVLEPMREGGGLERCFGVRLTCKSLKAPLVFEPPPFCPVIPTKTSSSIKIMKRNAIHARGQKFLSSWFWGGEGKGTYVSSGVKIII